MKIFDQPTKIFPKSVVNKLEPSGKTCQCEEAAPEREIQLAPAAARDKRQATSDKRQATSPLSVCGSCLAPDVATCSKFQVLVRVAVQGKIQETIRISFNLNLTVLVESKVEDDVETLNLRIIMKVVSKAIQTPTRWSGTCVLKTPPEKWENSFVGRLTASGFRKV